MVEGVLTWVDAHPVLAVLVALATGFLESVFLIGLFIPGIVVMFALAALVGWDLHGFLLLWAGASAGALCGDGLSFWLGRHYRDRLRALWPFSRRPDLFERGTAFFHAHGGKSVFLGRFIGPIRPLVPAVAGMLDMPARRFAALDVSACILWAPAYLLPGILFGASLELAAEFAGRLAVLMILAVAGIWLLVWTVRAGYEFLARKSTWWLKGAATWTRRHPVMGRLVGGLFMPGRREALGMVFLALLLTGAMAVLLTVLVIAPLGTPAWDAEVRAAGLAASLRSHYADPLLVVLSTAGDPEVLLFLSTALFLVLVGLRRLTAASHWAVVTGGAWLLAAGLNAFMGAMMDRPEAVAALGELPHRGFTLATAVFGFVAIILAKDVRARRRKWPYLAAVLVLAAIGFAHFYLGRAALSGLAVAWALGTAWLAGVGIAYRQRSHSRRGAGWLALGFYAGFVVCAAWHAVDAYTPVLTASRLAQPQRSLDANAWWRTDWQQLRDRRSAFGDAAWQSFDLQVAGDLGRLDTRLRAAGWEPLPSLTAANLAAVFSNRAGERNLPHLPRDFAGRPEELGLRLRVSPSEMLVLRLWASGARLQPGGRPVWLGQVRISRLKTVAGALSIWRQQPHGDDGAGARLRSDLDGWEGRQTGTGLWLIRPLRTPESPAGAGDAGADPPSP